MSKVLSSVGMGFRDALEPARFDALVGRRFTDSVDKDKNTFPKHKGAFTAAIVNAQELSSVAH